MGLIIYTDGSARGNPGPGGYGVLMLFGEHRKELSVGYRKTTNNRMELLAIITALESITKIGIDVKIISDSKYCIDAVTKGWLAGWVKKGFKGKKNRDLWERYLRVAPNFKVSFQWVKGHNGDWGNERVDDLAVEAAEGNSIAGNGLLVDEGFESGKFN